MFAHSIFISSIIQIFLAIHAVPIMVNLFLHVSSESVLCFGSVRCRSPGHCCVYAFCIFLRVAYLYMRLSLFFSSFGFVRCASMLGLNSYLYIFEGLFFLARANAQLRLGLRRAFFFRLRFVYLFRTPFILTGLRTFLRSTVCLIFRCLLFLRLQYLSVRHMRSQFAVSDARVF